MSRIIYRLPLPPKERAVAVVCMVCADYSWSVLESAVQNGKAARCPKCHYPAGVQAFDMAKPGLAGRFIRCTPLPAIVAFTEEYNAA